MTFATDIRRIILERSKAAGVGHIGSALSIADIIAVLYERVLRIDDPFDKDRERFILSKGHAAAALYAALHLRGFISEEQLKSYCTNGTSLAEHPEHVLPGVEFSTGSLGHGLSYAAGAALGARLSGSSRRTFALLSDAECNEGSVWEAAMFAAHHQLSSLIAFIDLNGQQGLGYTKDVLDLSQMADRWRSFGWDTHEVDGHDVVAMSTMIDGLDVSGGPPHMLVARTTFGRGVSFMENQIKWHYVSMNDDEFERALAEVSR